MHEGLMFKTGRGNEKVSGGVTIPRDGTPPLQALLARAVGGRPPVVAREG
jgi:hypothetical protein